MSAECGDLQLSLQPRKVPLVLTITLEEVTILLIWRDRVGELLRLIIQGFDQIEKIRL